MSRPAIHAEGGGFLRDALCEEPTGDTSEFERDVTCVDCLDIIKSGGVRVSPVSQAPDTIRPMAPESSSVTMRMPKSLRDHYQAIADAESVTLTYVLLRALEREKDRNRG